MARKKDDTDLAKLLEQVTEALKKTQDENKQLREAVETQTSAAAASQSRLADAVPTFRSAHSELSVGVRNISNNTIGIKAQFKGDPSLHLHADFGENDPNSVAIISYAWWRELRKSKFVDNGNIIRDDSIVGAGYSAAPADRPEDLAPNAKYNAIVDPWEWIDSRTEEEIRTDIEKITNDESLMRIRSVVDAELRKLESQFPRGTIPEQIVAAKKALRLLPAKLRFVDELTTMRLERVDDEAEPMRSVI